MTREDVLALVLEQSQRLLSHADLLLSRETKAIVIAQREMYLRDENVLEKLYELLPDWMRDKS